MSDSYHINLRDIPLDQYKQTLKEAELIPSRRMLKEDIDRCFELLRAQGINNLEELLSAASKAEEIADLADRTGLSVQYLTILRREVSALLPKPKNLRDFPGIRPATATRLEKLGIKNSKQLFESSRNPEQRSALATSAGVAPEDLLELVQLADLSRVYGVGPVFARLIYDAGVHSVAAIAGADAPRLFGKLAAAYLAAGNSRVDFSERDIAFCIRMAERLAGGSQRIS